MIILNFALSFVSLYIFILLFALVAQAPTTKLKAGFTVLMFLIMYYVVKLMMINSNLI